MPAVLTVERDTIKKRKTYIFQIHPSSFHSKAKVVPRSAATLIRAAESRDPSSDWRPRMRSNRLRRAPGFPIFHYSNFTVRWRVPSQAAMEMAAGAAAMEMAAAGQHCELTAVHLIRAPIRVKHVCIVASFPLRVHSVSVGARVGSVNHLVSSSWIVDSKRNCLPFFNTTKG